MDSIIFIGPLLFIFDVCVYKCVCVCVRERERERERGREGGRQAGCLCILGGDFSLLCGLVTRALDRE